jgi:hypothetical protein
VRAAVLAGQLERALVEQGAGGAVAERRFRGEDLDDLLDPGGDTGALEATDALRPEGEAHRAVDELEVSRQLILPRDEYNAADARRPPRCAIPTSFIPFSQSPTLML